MYPNLNHGRIRLKSMAKLSLASILNALGVEREEDLTPEEQDTYTRYKRILSGENLTIDKVKEFCLSQVKIIEDKIASNPHTENDMYYKACLHVYLNIIRAIEAPEMEREALEKHLEQLIKK